jgi:hypothetical protein
VERPRIFVSVITTQTLDSSQEIFEMSADEMDTETALSVVNKRIADTDLKETYFISRRASENALPTDDDYTVGLLESQTEQLRTVLVDFLDQNESELDEAYAEWMDNNVND